MREKHAEIARINTLEAIFIIGSQAVLVIPRPGNDTNWYNFEPTNGKLHCMSVKGALDRLRDGESVSFPVIPDQALRLQYIVEAARLRRIPEKSKWATKAYAFASVDAMLIDLLERGCGALACELVRYRGSDAPDPMDAIVMRVNHEVGWRPALEMDFFGFWVELFRSVNMTLPRTVRKNKPDWTWQTGPVKFSELLPSHQVKAMAAIKKFM